MMNQHTKITAILISLPLSHLGAATSEAPSIAYPYFSRPPSLGKDYNTWQDAKGPDVGETKTDPARLPSRVDNSQRPEFPPIYKQHGGACGQFTAIASIFTYEMNLLNGTKADTEATRFPADFSWNMINNAEKQNGSEAYHGWETAKQIGIPTVKSYGTVHRKEAGPWANGYSIWREAMEYRVAGYRYTPAMTVDQINEARGWLFDRNQPEKGTKAVGGLLALDGRMGKLEEVTKTIPDGQYEAGKTLWTRWCPDGFGHGITCAGYDDEIGFDVNGDGKITNDVDTNGDGKVSLADHERGAFIVVNSWGKKWANEGKVYMLYSAMTDSTWERGNYLGRIEVSRHIPRHTLKLKLSCDNRADLRATVGIAANKDATKPEHQFTPQVLNAWPIYGKDNNVGDVPLAGPNDKEPLELGIDITELITDHAKGDAKIFLQFSLKDGSKATASIHAAAIRNYDEKGTFINETPIEVKDGVFGTKPLSIQTLVPAQPSNS